MTVKSLFAKKRSGLGELEKAVMEEIWKMKQGTGREIHAIVGKPRDLAYTTVMTIMTRLVEKGVLCREELRDGSFLYNPCFAREEFYAKTTKAIFHELIKNFGAVAVAQFVDTLEEVDPKQLDALRKQLRDRRKK